MDGFFPGISFEDQKKTMANKPSKMDVLYQFQEILGQKMDGPNLFSEKLSASQVPDVDSTVVRLTDANIARNSKGFSQKHGSCLLFSASRIFTSPNCLQKKSHVDMAT